ncbi:MAG: anti-sigma factor, partial [Alphaproteobacteria bacterium]|nr:anti-sigma factor [Alphaproteobacteria bacterium]
MSRIDDAILMAYADGEVDADTAREIERAVETDAETRGRLARFRESAAVLRAAFNDTLYAEVPDRLRDAVLKTPAPAADNVLPLASRAKGATAPRRAFGLPLAAAIVGLVVGLGLGFADDIIAASPFSGRNLQREAWLDQVVNFHKVYAGIYEKQERALVDFGADDHPQIESFFGERLKRDLKIPDLGARGYGLQGGRLLVVGGRPAAQIVFVDKAGKSLALSILPSPGRQRNPAYEKRGGVGVLHWRS